MAGLDYVQLDYFKYAAGNSQPQVLIDAVRAAPPEADLYTGEISEQVARETGWHCIIATVSRTVVDLNRYPHGTNSSAISEYRETIFNLLKTSDLLSSDEKLKKPFLHIAVHGTKDRPDRDLEIGTVHGASSSLDHQNWFVSNLNELLQTVQFPTKTNIAIVHNMHFWGDPSKTVHRARYGENFNTIQIEIGRWLRENYRKQMIDILGKLVRSFPPK
jgi:N-formylglutamate amidohydrolase